MRTSACTHTYAYAAMHSTSRSTFPFQLIEGCKYFKTQTVEAVVVGTVQINATDEGKRARDSPRICNGSFTGGPDHNMFRLDTAGEMRSGGFAIRTPFAAAGFMFGAGRILRKVFATPSEFLSCGLIASPFEQPLLRPASCLASD